MKFDFCYDNNKVFNKNANFNTRVVTYLQSHKELLEDPDYLKLYNSSIDFFCKSFDKNDSLTQDEKEILKKAFEIVACSTDNDTDPLCITREEVDELLEKYKIFWKMQEDGVFDMKKK